MPRRGTPEDLPIAEYVRRRRTADAKAAKREEEKAVLIGTKERRAELLREEISFIVDAFEFDVNRAVALINYDPLTGEQLEKLTLDYTPTLYRLQAMFRAMLHTPPTFPEFRRYCGTAIDNLALYRGNLIFGDDVQDLIDLLTYFQTHWEDHTCRPGKAFDNETLRNIEHIQTDIGNLERWEASHPRFAVEPPYLDPRRPPILYYRDDWGRYYTREHAIAARRLELRRVQLRHEHHFLERGRNYEWQHRRNLLTYANSMFPHIKWARMHAEMKEKAPELEQRGVVPLAPEDPGRTLGWSLPGPKIVQPNVRRSREIPEGFNLERDADETALEPAKVLRPLNEARQLARELTR
jgi:hypothetical protein